jgi:two-component system invasion response regulator UvrY
MSEQAINSDLRSRGFNSLTQREFEIISLIKKGASSKEIADRMSITLKTTEMYRQNILKKLKLKNTAALINFIYTRNLN